MGEKNRRKLTPRERLAVCVSLAAGYDDGEVAERCKKHCKGLTPELVEGFRSEFATEIEEFRRRQHERALGMGFAVPVERVRRLNHVAYLVEQRMEDCKDDRGLAMLVKAYVDLSHHVVWLVETITRADNDREDETIEAARREFAGADAEYQAAFGALSRAAARMVEGSRRDRPAVEAGEGI